MRAIPPHSRCVSRAGESDTVIVPEADRNLDILYHLQVAN